MDDDAVGSRCPECNSELDALPVAADHHLAMGLLCPVHGSVAVLEPF